MNTAIQDFESFEHKDYKHDLNACHILPPQMQLSDAVLRFGRIKKIFCRNITITALLVRIHWEFSIPSPRCFQNISTLRFSSTRVLESSLPLGRPSILLVYL